MSSPVIIADKVVKSFGSFHALAGVDLEVQPGECFGLLGPNGAGKSTFINLAYGAISRTGGSLKIMGLDPETQAREVKKRIGVVTQENALDESLTVEENMLLYAAFVGVPSAERKPRVNELLEYMSLSHKAGEAIKALSGGMKRRLVFVRALLSRPELLILDEPTTGLDPAVRHLLWQKVHELREQKVTILLTTHYMHEAELLCDRVAILNKGQVLQTASPKAMIDESVPGFMGIYSIDDRIKQRLESSASKDKRFHLTFRSSGIYLRTEHIEDLLALHLREQIVPLQMRPTNLEDVFLKMTGEELAAHD